MNPSSLAPPKGYATILIDYENFYYYFKNFYPALSDPQECVLETVRGLQRHLREKLHLEPLVINAYADFERMGPGAQLGALYLLGASTHNVLGTQHKNAADMQLCIDGLEMLYTRPDITSFVFMAGDRDYIPIIQHLRRQGRQILVVGFKQSTSGDLLQIIGDQHYVDALSVLSESRRAALTELENAAVLPPLTLAPSYPVVPIENELEVQEVKSTVAGTGFMPQRRVSGERAFTCLSYLLRDAVEHKSSEVWLSPFLRRLTDIMTQLPDFERRNLINELRDCGCIRVEKREGFPNPFSVVVFNYNHPDVQRANPSA
jgi:hypothetical protein